MPGVPVQLSLFARVRRPFVRRTGPMRIRVFSDPTHEIDRQQVAYALLAAGRGVVARRGEQMAGSQDTAA